MTMAAAIENRPAEAPARSKQGRLASIDIFNDLACAETTWPSLETSEQIFTAYQRFDFLNS
jgi:hypothetical protein